MFELIGLVAALSAAFLGYFKTREFVRNRLRYVDGVHDFSAALKAGLGATVIGAVVVTFVPFIGAPTALLFGLAVGAGVRAGANDIRKRLPGH